MIECSNHPAQVNKSARELHSVQRDSDRESAAKLEHDAKQSQAKWSAAFEVLGCVE